MYSRKDIINGEERLVFDNQTVGYREHMAVKHRTLFLSGVVTGETDFHNLLMAMDSPPYKPVILVISSTGGDLDSAFFYHDTMNFLQSPIITIGRYCASAAALIFASGSRRLLYPHAKVMLHLPSSYFGVGVSIGVQDMAIIQRQAEMYKNKMVDI